MSGRDRLAAAMDSGDLWLPRPVVSEMLSARLREPEIEAIIREAPQLPISEGFWERAGESRRRVRLAGRRAPLADALIAQCCIDADAPLMAHDGDFRAFAELCGLRLVLEG